MIDTPTYALHLENLTKTYPNGFTALAGLDLCVPVGGFFALLGLNGAGKSTTISIISALMRPTSGKVEIFGVDLHKNSAKAKRYLGVVPQEFNFNQFEKCIDILVTQAGYFGIRKKDATPRALYLLDALGLLDKKDDKARALSGGMKRRLMIARALMHKPKLLILDEPTAGVDIELRRSMWEFIQKINQKEKVTIILTTHYLEEAEQLCKNIAILDKGRIKINTTMKDLLAGLNAETFVLDLDKPSTPKLDVERYVMLDDKMLEVSLKPNQNLNSVFLQLDKQNIGVLSMRNKTNRLEELFMQYVDQSQNAPLE